MTKDVLQDVSFTARGGRDHGAGRPLRLRQEHLRPACRQIMGCHQGSIKVGGVDISTVDPEVLLSDYSMVFRMWCCLMTR